MLMEFPTFLYSNKIYKPNQILDVIKMVRKNFRLKYSNAKQKYFNVPCAFDIETSSFRSTGNNEKTAIMYVWTFGIYGCIIMGRTWNEFIYMLKVLSNELNLNQKKRLIIYVHNLSFEFQFLRGWFTWLKVFSIEPRKPIYALTDMGIEFRCSYLLSGYSLKKLSSQLRVYKFDKLTGDLDYEKMRHNKTPLTDKEIMYCVNDVKVVIAFIAEQMETLKDDNICLLPLTKTGYVRNYCRNNCFFEPGESRKNSFKRQRYMNIMNGLRLTVGEYEQLKRAFQGGFTHANPFYTGKIVKDVTSYDFTSSYPTVMIAEKFPISSSEVINLKSMNDFRSNLSLYCCLFDVEFSNLESQLYIDNYISISRCFNVKNAVINNGRVVSADNIATTITEQDFFIIEKFYKWKSIKIRNFRRYKKGYLPTDFIKSILKLYGDKTTLKGVSGREYDYLISKEMLNSCYGMCVTDIIRDEINYDNIQGWLPTTKPDFDESIKQYNNSRSRFLFYPWGVWVTAYARKNLFTGILEFNEDYVYSDTDSIKVINAEKHNKYLQGYNNMIKCKLLKAIDFHKLNHDLIEPKTVKGDKKLLGVWDFDGEYKKFKTLGAKRYLVQYSDNEKNREHKNTYNLTVSGLNKNICMPYLLKKYGDNVFNEFTDDLYIPPKYTGKNTHTYIDDIKQGEIIDYKGIKSTYYELSGVHLEKSDYSLKMSREYLNYILNIETLT